MKTLEVSRIFVFGLAASVVFAQMRIQPGMAHAMPQGMGPGLHGGMHRPIYDPSTVTTIKGTVEEVQEGNAMMSHHTAMMNQQATMMEQQSGMTKQGQMKNQAGRMGWMGTHLILKTDKGPLTVIVGPSDYLTAKNFSFVKGDKLQVTGSRVTFNGQEELIARSIKKGDRILTLRNDQGVPLWSRSKRGW